MYDRRVRRGRWVAAAVAVAVVLIGGACSPPKFRYVSNGETDTYLKVPRSWAEFDQPELAAAEARIAAQEGQGPSAVDTFIERLLQWRVAFDADPSPSLEHVVDYSMAPVVDVRVRKLLETERDQVSLSSLRNLFLPYDELKAEAEQESANREVASPTSSGAFRAIDEQELKFDDGMRGMRLIFGVRGPDGEFYTFDQTALLDGKTERVYALLIRASEREYFSNSTLLDEIAKSFTVKRKG